MVGVLSTREALEMAEEASLDLIEISPNAVPPVAKISDYGKYKYEEKKKADRCLRIARRKYDKPSAYRSGAIVQCRRGKIWKGLSESDINDAPEDIQDLIYKAHDAITRRKGKDYAPDVHELQAWIDDHLEQQSEGMDEAKKTDFSKEKKSGLH